MLLFKKLTENLIKVIYEYRIGFYLILKNGTY